MRRAMKVAALSAAAAMVLAACGDAPEDEPTTGGGTTESPAPTDSEEEPTETGEEPTETGEEPTETEGGGSAGGGEDFTGCMVSDAGGFDDQSFNQSGAQGMEAAEDAYGIDVVFVESQSDSEYSSNVSGLVQQGCDLVIGVGFLLEEAIQEGADANPDVNFALIDSAFSDDDFNPIELENGKPILFNTAEAAFLAGYLAAGMTETGTVATFGGIPIPSVTIFMDGFAIGVEQYNEDNGTGVNVLGWDRDAQDGAFSGDFDNQANGQSLAENFIAQGADIILPVAGPVGLGAAGAAENVGDVWIIWVDSDGYLTTDYGSIILTSVMKEIGPAVEGTIGETLDTGFNNEPYVGTLENGGVGLAPFHDFDAEVPQELKDAIADYEQQIIDGSYTVESVSTPGR